MLLDVLPGKLVQVRIVAQADFLCFSFGVLDLPTVAQHSANHPERAHANRRSAMNEGGPVRRVVRDLEKLVCLLVFWIAGLDGDVEVAQAEFPGF
jgi:hypothetical protein